MCFLKLQQRVELSRPPYLRLDQLCFMTNLARLVIERNLFITVLRSVLLIAIGDLISLKVYIFKRKLLKGS